MKLILLFLISISILCAADKHIDVAGWDDTYVVPVYADGTSINPDGTLNLSDPEERAAYEKLPALRKSCSAGKASSCYEIGRTLQQESFKYIYNPSEAITWFSKACEKNHTDACYHLASAYFTGEGTEVDMFKAFTIAKKLCAKKHAISCYNLGVQYEHGFGIRQDTMTAWELYGKACDLGSQDGCTAYAAMNRASESRK